MYYITVSRNGLNLFTASLSRIRNRQRELTAPQLGFRPEPTHLPLKVFLQQSFLVRGELEQRGDGAGQVLRLVLPRREELEYDVLEILEVDLRHRHDLGAAATRRLPKR